MRMSNLGRNLAVVDRPISEFANENFFSFVYDNKILGKGPPADMLILINARRLIF